MLIGNSVTLRAPQHRDEKFLFKLRNDFQSQSLLLALPRANSVRRVSEWVHGMLSDKHSVFFIVATRSGAPAGFVQVRNMDFVHRTGDLGIYVSPAARGRGVAAEALQLLEAYVVDTFDLRKMVLRVLAANKRAIAFYRRSGYSLVGTHRQHFYQAREFHDVAVMEKLL